MLVNLVLSRLTRSTLNPARIVSARSLGNASASVDNKKSNSVNKDNSNNINEDMNKDKNLNENVSSTATTTTTTATPNWSSTSASLSGSSYASRVRRRDLRFAFPEFLPDPNPDFRNATRERLERQDMLRRRRQVELPEFYVGSILSATFADPNSPGPNKQSTFVGICIDRGGQGLRAWFVLRNVIDNQGVEFRFDLYSAVLVRLEVLRLERRLDSTLLYLRDALPEYSTVPLDMTPEVLPEDAPVPLNPLVVRMKPHPWTRHWERHTDKLHGFTYVHEELSEFDQIKLRVKDSYMNLGWKTELNDKYDLMRDYRETISIEEQDAIWDEVGDELIARDKQIRMGAVRRSFALSDA